MTRSLQGREQLFLFVFFFFFYSGLSSQTNTGDIAYKLNMNKIDSLFDLSDKIWLSKGPSVESIQVLSTVDSLARSYGYFDTQLFALIKLATVSQALGDEDKYLDFTNKAVELISTEEIKDVYLKSIVYFNLTNIYRKRRQYRKSIANANLGLSLEGIDEGMRYLLNLRMSENYVSLGNYNKAIEILNYSKALKYYDIFDRYDLFEILGNTYSKQGRESNAINNYLEAEKALLSTNSYDNELFNLWIDIARTYHKNGQVEEGDIYLEKFFSSNKEKNDVSLGFYHYVKSLRDFQFTDYDIEVLVSNLQLSNDYFKRAKTFRVSLDKSISKNFELIGDVYSLHNKKKEAIKAYDLAIEQLGYSQVLHKPSEILNKEIVIRIIHKLFNIYAASDSELAEKYEAYLVGMIRVLRIENSTESTAQFWAEENLKLFESLLEYNFTKKKKKEMLSLLEENKSNLLIRDLKHNDVKGFANVPSDILDREEELIAEINYLKALMHTTKDSIAKENAIHKLGNVISKLDNLVLGMERDYPEYHKLKYDIEGISSSEIQKLIKEDELFIEYFIGEEKGYVAFVSKSKIEIQELIDFGSFKSLALEYYKAISNKENNIDKNENRQLFEALKLDAVKEMTPQTKRIILVCDDILNNIPFELLEDNEGNTLMSNYEIQYQYSARLWQMLKSRKSENKTHDFVGYAYNSNGEAFVSERSCTQGFLSKIRCANPEIESVIEIIDSGSSRKMDDSIEELFEASADTRILHLATHACLDESNSDLSRIYFNDTLLTNQDLKLKNINADLVVLSACETGFGEVIKGEGSMSLSKGFFHAGAKSTLVSLWPVDDCATSDLMTYFYQNLKEGQSKDASLRNAKLSYVENANPELRHPYYWAGFIVIGDCNPIWTTNSKLVMILGGLLLLTFILFLVKRYRR